MSLEHFPFPFLVTNDRSMPHKAVDIGSLAKVYHTKMQKNESRKIVTFVFALLLSLVLFQFHPMLLN